MKHRPAIDLGRTTVIQMRYGDGWCTCGRRLVLIDLAGARQGWRHTPR